MKGTIKKEKSKCNEVKRVLIEREDGTIAYDGKPDLFACYLADCEDKTVDETVVQFAEKKNVCPQMVVKAINHLEDIIKNYAGLGLELCLKNKE